MPGQPSVLVVGESLTDIIATNGGESRHPGGSPMNVAYGLGRLDVATTFLTSLGADEDGRAIVAHLESAGVEVVASSINAARTGSALATLDAGGSASYRFDIRWEMPPAPHGLEPSLIHTGSLATFLLPGALEVEKLLESASGQTIITYDPNVRPALLEDHREAVAQFERFARLADVVKLSDEDARWLYPDEAVGAVVDQILEFGAGLAIVTQGAAGASLASAVARVDVPAAQVTVRDTVGAGDSYMSAVIVKVLELGTLETVNLGDEDLAAIGEWAAQVSALTVMRPGAAPPSKLQVSRHLANLRRAGGSR